MDSTTTPAGKVTVRLVREHPTEEIVRLYKAAGWWRSHYDPSHIAPMVLGSYAFAVAVDGATGRTVGMGRLISDRASDAYVQDVIVEPAYRGRGIARRIVDALLEVCRADGILWVGLLAEPGSLAFWKRAGFRSLEGFVPMRLGGEDRPC
jgi:GNAT superfamily N-acetyltransferase